MSTQLGAKIRENNQSGSNQMGDERTLLTDRVKRLKETYLAATPQLSGERSHFFTRCYQRLDGEPVVIRRAKSFSHVLENISISIRDDELIVGGQTNYVRGASIYPEFSNAWIKKELDELPRREVRSIELNEEDQKMILEDIAYWEGKSTQDMALALWEERWGSLVMDAHNGRVLFVDIPVAEGGRSAVDYPKALNGGLNGIIKEVKDILPGITVNSHQEMQKKWFLEAVIIVCEAVIKFAERYARLATRMAEEGATPERKRELAKIAEACQQVPANPPRSFYEAVQSFWFIHLALLIENCAHGYSPGRFDQYMYPFYKKDVDNGHITKEQATELLCCLFIKFTEIEEITSLDYIRITSFVNMYQNMTIGGQTQNGKSAVNDLSYLILDVCQAVKVIQPTVSLRYFDGLPEKFLLRGAEVVASGGGMPAWFNDKYALATLSNYGIPLREARDYAPVGCVEIGVPGSSVQFHGAGFISVAKCLELALNNGMDPLTRQQLGPKTGNVSAFENYDMLYDAFKKQMTFFADIQAKARNIRYSLFPEFVPVPYNSALMNDCISEGKDLSMGGGRYNNFLNNVPFGMVSTANSLTAIRKLIYEDKNISWAELLDALATNFEGRESLRRLLLDAPKYGNGDQYADQTLDELYKFCSEVVRKHNNVFGEPFAPTFQGVTSHYHFGEKIGALPDGRMAYTPLADGSLSPFPGTDTNGPTAVIQSASSIDLFPALGNLLNIKFHPTAMKRKEDLRKFLALIKTLYDLYGYHIQFNVVSAETLRDAQKHPEKYRDLVVRVAGFSAFWVELAPAVQNDIITRTEHHLG